VLTPLIYFLIIMNKNTYLGLALAVCMSIVSVLLLAEISPVPEHPGYIAASAISVKEHQEAAEFHKEYKEHYLALAQYHESAAAAYGKSGDQKLKKHHEEMAIVHEEMAKTHEKAATTDEIEAGRNLHR